MVDEGSTCGKFVCLRDRSRSRGGRRTGSVSYRIFLRNFPVMRCSRSTLTLARVLIADRADRENFLQGRPIVSIHPR